MATPRSDQRYQRRLLDEAYLSAGVEREERERPEIVDYRPPSLLASAAETATTIDEELKNAPAGAYEKERPLQGLTTWINKRNGFRIIDLEYIADPAKRSVEWYERNRKGIPRREWEREYGRRWTIYSGKPVYSEFAEDRHTFDGKIVIADRVRLVHGWDGGPTDVNLAWTLALVNVRKLTIRFVDEYFADDGDVEDFVQSVQAKLHLDWARYIGGNNVHVADQAVFTESKIEQKSFADILRKHGIYPIPGEISFAKRRACVERKLKEHEGFMIHERCKMSVEAMGGGYVYGALAGGIGGQYKETPLKNEFSHIANTIEYVCSRLDVATQAIPYEGRPLPRRQIV